MVVVLLSLHTMKERDLNFEVFTVMRQFVYQALVMHLKRILN